VEGVQGFRGRVWRFHPGYDRAVALIFHI
jgi:hypothetical protein